MSPHGLPARALGALGFALGVLSLGLVPACSTEAYCFSRCDGLDVTPLDGGDAGTAAGGSTNLLTDGGSINPGFGGSGGAVYDEAGAPCADKDLQTDPHNCGTCGSECAISGARPACVAGQCQIDSCSFGRWDIDGKLDNGCEYACVPSADTTEVCNGFDDDCNGTVDDGFDLETDVHNCGACNSRCDLPNTAAVCSGGICKLTTCADGYYDLNHVDSDGCEYACVKSNGGVEICDGLDNNCDGVPDDHDPGAGQPCDTYCPNGVCQGICTSGTQICVAGSTVCIPGIGPKLETCDGTDEDCDGTVDNGFDFTTDPHNCGMCGNDCTGAFANGIGTCVASQCVLLVCNDGYKDYDPSSTGCERCPVWPTTTESCNGADDDCDGIVDNASALNAKKPPIAFCNNKAGTPCATVQIQCLGTLGWTCVYPTGVELDASGKVRVTESRCDGVDGNCDGNVDEAFQNLGTSCDDGGLGVCKDSGKFACDPNDNTKTYCDLTVLPDPLPGAPFVSESCNGLDDNCDGRIDENSENMVHVIRNGLDFYIDRFEASRPDATAAKVGLDESHVCANAAVLPWTDASYSEAKTACENSGRRLCTAAEMQEACVGVAQTAFPYGSSYDGQKCDGLDYTGSTNAPVKTGSLLACVSQQTVASTTDGVFDLSGNVNEWTSTVVGNTGAPANLPIQALQGGSFLSPANGLACGFSLDRISTNAVLPSLGFRCCKDP